MTRLNLVTGGAGFVGRHLVHRLVERGERVRVLDLDAGAGLPDGIDYRRASILDAEAVRRALDGVERVFHLAANPNLWSRRPESFAEVNLEGTRTVLSLAGAWPGVSRIVYTSTESILKSYRWKRPPTASGFIDETIELSADDMPGPYCRSKFLAERLALDMARAGAPIVVVNPTLPIGPGDHRRTPPTEMLLGFLNGKTPAYLESEFNMIDVRDVAAGHILAAERGNIGERYILGTRNIRLSGVLAILARLSGLPMPRLRVPYVVALAAAHVSEAVAYFTGKPPVAPLTGVRLARTPMAFDCAKAIAALDLPQTPLETSLADFIRWHRARGEIRPTLDRLPSGLA